MASREEMIAELKTIRDGSQSQEQTSTREEMIQEIRSLRDEKPTALESAARGAAQGFTYGFADEAVGAAQGLYDDAKSFFTDEANANNKKPVYDKNGRVTNPKELTGSYEKNRDESRAAFKLAEETNPSAYAAGEIGAGIAAAAIPVGSTATLANAIKTGATLGGLSALGTTEAKNIGTVAKDVGIGAALGGAGGAFAKTIENAIPAVKSGIKGLAQKATDESLDTAQNVLSKESGSMPIGDQTAFKDAAVSAKNRIKSFWNPEVDPKFKDFVDIAKKNGIDPNLLPESVRFGPDSSASRAARSLAEGRFGEESLKKFNSGLDQVRKAYDKKIYQYAKGAPVDEVTAGNLLRDSYDQGVTKFFDQMDITHNTVMKMVPDLKMTDKALGNIESSLNGVEKFAKGRLERGVTKTQKVQAEQLLGAVQAIRNGNGSYKQTVEALRDIGEAAFQTKNSMADIPVDVQKMRKIYNDLNEGLIDSVRSQLGDDVAGSLVNNNRMMHEFFGDKSLVSRVLGDKSIAPEKAFQSLILNGDSQRIAALKKVIDPEMWNYLKGAVLENIAKRDPEGGFTFKQLYNSMRNKKSALSSIFSQDELIENAGLVRLGDRFGAPVLSSSGTGASLSWQDLYQVPTNISIDALALRNANNAAKKTINQNATQSATKMSTAIKDVTPTLKELPVKAAGAMLGTTEKGYDKWASDGAQKLQQHDSAFSKDQIEQLKNTKKGRDLLIRASYLKPKSKAMDNLIGQIKEIEDN